MFDVINNNSHSNLDIEQFVTFRVDNLFFGVSVKEVQEIIRYQEMTSVPLSPTFVSGLVNLRGQIITVVDMRSLLNLESHNSLIQQMIIVLLIEGEKICILVDKIGDVVDVTPQTFEETPTTFSNNLLGVVNGVHKLRGDVMLILNTKTCFEIL